MEALETKIYGEIYGVRADDWANAADNVEQLGDDGWQSTQYQVADFRHDATAALRQVMVESLSYGGAVEMDDVDSAVGNEPSRKHQEKDR